MPLTIWIDADACPRSIKDIVIKGSQRTATAVVMVANQPMRMPPSKLARFVLVSSDFDAADSHIVQNLEPGDIVITADVPLADLVISKEAHAINPRGEFYTKENIKDKLSMRDLMAELRSGGMVSGGPKEFSAADVKAFANSFDKILTKRCNEVGSHTRRS